MNIEGIKKGDWVQIVVKNESYWSESLLRDGKSKNWKFKILWVGNKRIHIMTDTDNARHSREDEDTYDSDTRYWSLEMNGTFDIIKIPMYNFDIPDEVF